jgi:hypothetical protein
MSRKFFKRKHSHRNKSDRSCIENLYAFVVLSEWSNIKNVYFITFVYVSPFLAGSSLCISGLGSINNIYVCMRNNLYKEQHENS